MIQPFKKGDAITAEWANALPRRIAEMIIRDYIGAGPGIAFQRTGSRVNISTRAALRSSASVDPFTAHYIGVNGTKAVLAVKQGTINDLDEGTGLNVIGKITSPDAGWWRFEVAASATRYLMARAQIETNGTVTAAKLQIEETATVTPAGNSSTGAPPGFAYRKLARFVTDGAGGCTITQYSTGAQQAFVVVTGWGCTTLTKNVLWLP